MRGGRLARQGSRSRAVEEAYETTRRRRAPGTSKKSAVQFLQTRNSDLEQVGQIAQLKRGVRWAADLAQAVLEVP